MPNDHVLYFAIAGMRAAGSSEQVWGWKQKIQDKYFCWSGVITEQAR